MEETKVCSEDFIGQKASAVIVQSITRTYGDKTVLDRITLSIPKGELFGLLGPSGSGKTTLIRAITGLEQTDSGTVTLLHERMPQRSMLRRFGYMAQADALYNELTGRQNMAFFGALYGLQGKQLQARIEDCARLVDLSGDLARAVRTYSGGMKRRLSLAIALLHEPELLVLDEPTVGIDPLLRRTIWQELSGLRSSGTTIIVTTHVMDEAEKCDRLGLIQSGKLIALGTPDEIKFSAGAASIEEAFIALGKGGRP
ncbi:ABC transporter ATP-binding protein [Paenibacillus protaetiae]|uniref:ABC transporter ATP-binding protein n=1 Tax=Paenibacillus protaetiae TaxID=2509456 RepID=A0A4P6EV00_9BACL|nr:ABC transporter ATP-binding protein [Paenibacillus protaetiae]QAY65469.1 ABC transporter ATP-binding protein [Paenibacillus protaetiae]